MHNKLNYLIDINLRNYTKDLSKLNTYFNKKNHIKQQKKKIHISYFPSVVVKPLITAQILVTK